MAEEIVRIDSTHLEEIYGETARDCEGYWASTGIWVEDGIITVKYEASDNYADAMEGGWELPDRIETKEEAIEVIKRRVADYEVDLRNLEQLLATVEAATEFIVDDSEIEHLLDDADDDDEPEC